MQGKGRGKNMKYIRGKCERKTERGKGSGKGNGGKSEIKRGEK